MDCSTTLTKAAATQRATLHPLVDVKQLVADVLSQFVKVMPTDYKRVLAERRRHDEEIESAIRDVDQTGGFEAVVK